MIETGKVQSGGVAWGGWLQVPLLLVPRRTFRLGEKLKSSPGSAHLRLGW